MPRPLVRYEDYTREEVHDLFSPRTTFTPQSGTWGLQGIVSVPGRPSDYVFFVTYGQKQGDHEFDEGVTEDGVLTWQSQPKQRFADRQIQELIKHNEDTNSIHLFLRTDSGRLYTYLGWLKYLSHDTQREQPVHFKWQILDWGINQQTLSRMHLTLLPSSGGASQSEPAGAVGPQHVLTPAVPPSRTSEGLGRGVETQAFRGRRMSDPSRREAANRELGLAGELLVLRYEGEELRRLGRLDLADQVRHVSVLEGDGAGYDILSFDVDGGPKHIEVKTTTGTSESDFFASATEVAFSEKNPQSYHLYRVFNYDRGTDAGDFFVIRGALAAEFGLRATQFRARR